MSLFTEVQVKVPKRRRFNRSFESHVSSNFGILKPVVVEEVFPGDGYKTSVDALIKLAPLQVPAMARIDAYFHWFFVPTRLLYKNWEAFITGGTDGTEPNGTIANPVAPYIDINEMYNSGVNYLKPGSLADFFGLPSFSNYQGSAFQDIPPISAFPWLAYHKIFSDWYRDELLDNYEFQPVGDGNVKVDFALADLNTPRYRAWKKDYFTSARPDTQLGAEEGVPITGSIVQDGSFKLGTTSPGVMTTRGIGFNSSYAEDLGTGETPRFVSPTVLMNNDGTATTYDLLYSSGLSLQDASILINDLRRSLKAQEWKEKNMRGGNRYIENIFHHFGVKSSDARLQRSQYLGGKKIPVVIGEVLQSVDTGNGTPGNATSLGHRGGVGAAGGRSNTVKFSAEEHGFLMCIMSILPHASYQQGIPRYLANRWDRYEYLWPEFGNLGEQEVYNWELFANPGSSQNNGGVFGYQSRYADMKTRFSEIHGDFRTSGLDMWTNVRKFSSRPNLNANFVYFPSDNDAGGQNRIFVVSSNANGDHFWCHLFVNMSVLRMLPRYGIPSI